MIDTSVVSLKDPPMNVLTMPGIEIFSACGMMISRMRLPVVQTQGCRPLRTDPFGRAARPPRITSAI